jgi:hypothetical protein
MTASCGTRSWRSLERAKIAAPRKVKAMLKRNAAFELGSIPKR